MFDVDGQIATQSGVAMESKEDKFHVGFKYAGRSTR